MGNLKEIPCYPRFRIPLKAGVKTWTSRSKQYVGMGDLFQMQGVPLECDAVIRLPFWRILEHWREEGFDSKQDFLDTWKKIHPRKWKNFQALYFVHIFHKIEVMRF